MKKLLFMLLSLVLLMLGGCETRTFEYVATISKTWDYPVDQEGAFVTTRLVDAGELNDELDLPEGAIIGDVYVEALSVALEHLAENEATGVMITGYANDRMFVEDMAVSINPATYELTAMANLVSAGVKTISDDLAAYFMTGSPATIEFRLEGDSHPDPGERIHIRIIIEMTLTVQYALESEFPNI